MGRHRVLGYHSGPSPRAWGLHLFHPLRVAPLRSIPTCVGTTRGHWPMREMRSGPSPRAWGLRIQHPLPGGAGRSIPTCVGTMCGRRGGMCAPSVHPHVRGDYARPRSRPPREARSIPACVGTTRANESGRCWPSGPSPRAWGLRPLSLQGGAPTVHPHVRGDYVHAQLRRPLAQGPSPRAWGLPGQPLGLGGPPRSIPTCVGTTFHPNVATAPLAVHPHVRGDYRATAFHFPEAPGPSPRAWGLHGHGVVLRAHQRSIPTCVGTTGKRKTQSASPPGPSPRAWGLRGPPRPPGPLSRSIPTCVGTTWRVRLTSCA